MANKTYSNLAGDINKLVKPARNYQTLDVKAERVAIGQARGSGKSSENAVGGGSGDINYVQTTVTSSDGFFVFEVMTDSSLLL